MRTERREQLASAQAARPDQRAEDAEVGGRGPPGWGEALPRQCNGVVARVTDLWQRGAEPSHGRPSVLGAGGMPGPALEG